MTIPGRHAGDPRGCRICGDRDLARHLWPPIRYAEREFRFYRCGACASISIHPTPDAAVMELMYGPRSATAETPGSIHPSLPYYRRVQLRYLHLARPDFVGSMLLDFGCGGGFYLRQASALGLRAVGIEFGESYAAAQRQQGLDVHTMESFRKAHDGRPFDIIHLGHVLEHAPEPARVICELRDLTHCETKWLIDGPLEANPCLSRLVIDLGSRLRRRAWQTIEPQHLTCTTAAGQLAFFEKLGFATTRFRVHEQAWPLPDRPDWGSPKQLLKYSLALFSRATSSLVPGFGNLFHYCGTLPASAPPPTLSPSQSGLRDARRCGGFDLGSVY